MSGVERREPDANEQRKAWSGKQSISWDGWPAAPAEPFTPCEQTIRHCIGEVDRVIHESGHFCPQRMDIIAALEALLPPKDRAKEIAAEYLSQSRGLHYECFEDMARWLDSKGMIKW